MNGGVVCCAFAGCLFLIFGIAFALLKEKGALLISGFNSLPKDERAHYDQEAMARDMRNDCFKWAGIMATGCLLSYFVSPFLAFAAYVVWLVLLLKDVRLTPDQAFKKYRI